MTTSPGDSDELRWLLEPPGAGDVQFYISVGENVEVTEEVQAAIDRLLDSFQSNEVEGYGTCWPKCPDLKDCKGTFQCNGLNNCTTLWRIPCAAKIACDITKLV